MTLRGLSGLPVKISFFPVAFLEVPVAWCQLDVEEFISDAFKTVYTFGAPLISIVLPAQG